MDDAFKMFTFSILFILLSAPISLRRLRNHLMSPFRLYFIFICGLYLAFN